VLTVIRLLTPDTLAVPERRKVKEKEAGIFSAFREEDRSE